MLKGGHYYSAFFFIESRLHGHIRRAIEAFALGPLRNLGRFYAGMVGPGIESKPLNYRATVNALLEAARWRNVSSFALYQTASTTNSYTLYRVLRSIEVLKL